MSPELLCWVINHHSDEYVMLAFDDAAQELYVQVDRTLYIVGYEDVAQIHSLEAAEFRRRVVEVGQAVEPNSQRLCGPTMRLSA